MAADNDSIDTIFWVLKSKKSGRLISDYNFELPGAPNSNDNTLLVCFNDGPRHDAEISASRHFGNDWDKQYDLIAVRLNEVVDYDKTNRAE